MLELVTTSAFRKDLKIAKKRGYNLSLIELVIDELLKENTLAPKYKDHALIGNYIWNIYIPYMQENKFL